MMVEVSVPRDTVNDVSVVVLDVFKTSGSIVQRGEIVVRIETSKTAIDIESPQDGFIEHSIMVGAEIQVGEVLFSVVDENNIYERGQENASKSSDVSMSGVEFSLNSAKAIKDFDINVKELENLKWVTSSDLKIVNRRQETVKTVDEHTKISDEVVENNRLESNINQISKRKKTEIQNLIIGNHASTTSVIGVHLHLPGERTSIAPYLFKKSILDLVIFEASRLLMVYPELNARYIKPDSYMIYKDINVGVSFDNGRNLKVLAIKETNILTLQELQKEIEYLLNLYDSNAQIPIDVLTSSTITISDLSQTSAAFVLPLINGMQSLIIAIVQPKPGSYSLFGAFDHRISEGMQVTKFLTELSDRVISHYLKDGVVNISCSLCGRKMSDETGGIMPALLKCSLRNGEDGYICRGCFNGW